MPGRKLSGESRIALRKEMRAEIKAETPVGQMLRAISSKYSIAYETARWYYKHLDNEQASPPKKTRRARGKGRGVAKKARSRIRRRGPGRGRLSLPRLIRLTQRLTEEELRRALAAKKLVARLEIEQAREQDLKKELRRAQRRFTRLRRRIKRLGTL
jgi:hypothetical protein